MAVDVWAAAVPAVILLLAACFALRLTWSRTADPKFQFLNALLKSLEEEKSESRHKTAA